MRRVKNFKTYLLSGWVMLIFTACQVEGDIVIKQVEPAEAPAGSVVRLIGAGFRPNLDQVTVGEHAAPYAEETLEAKNLSNEAAEDVELNEVAIIIPVEVSPGDVFIQVSNEDGHKEKIAFKITTGTANNTTPSSALGDTETPEDNNQDNAAETPEEVEEPAPVVEEPLDYSATQFFANEPVVYKGKDDNAPKVVELSWNLGPSVPDKLIIEGPGWTVEKTGTQAQVGTRQVEVSQSNNFILKAVNNGEVVYQINREVPVQNIEDNFTLSVDIANEAKPEIKGVILTPENDYKDPNKIKVVYEADSFFDKFCFTKPKTSGPSYQDTVQAPQANGGKGINPNKYNLDFKGVELTAKKGIGLNTQSNTSYKIIGKSGTTANQDFNVGTVKLYDLFTNEFVDGGSDAPAMQTEIVCTDSLSGTITFEMTGDVHFEYYVKKDDEEFLRNAQQLKFTILKPKVTNHDLAKLSVEDAQLKYSYDFQDAKSFFIATTSTDKLKSNAPTNPSGSQTLTNKPETTHAQKWSGGQVNLNEQNFQLNKGVVNTTAKLISKNADCTIAPSGNMSGICANEDVQKSLRTRFGNNKTIYVFAFNKHDMKGDYYVEPKAGQFKVKFVAGGFGNNDKIFLSGNQDEEYMQPNLLEVCDGAAKDEIFGPYLAHFEANLKGVKEVGISREDCEASGANTCTKIAEGDYDCNSVCTYKGDHPKFIIKGKDFIGTPIDYTCSYGKIKDWPIDIALTRTNKRLSFKMSIKGSKSGIVPFKKWRVVPYGSVDGNSQKCEELAQPVSFDPERDGISSFDKWGFDCYKFRLQVMRTGKSNWEPVKMISTGTDKWKANFSGSGDYTIKFPPKPTFSVAFHKGTAYQNYACHYHTDSVFDDWDHHGMKTHWLAEGTGITSVSCSCSSGCNRPTTGSLLNVTNDESFTQKEVVFEWRGEVEDGRDYRFDCTATGADGQTLNWGYNYRCNSK